MPTPELRIIRDISAVMADTPDYQEGLNRSAALVAERLGFDACSILIHDEGNDELILAAWSGPEAPTDSFRLSPSRGITGYSFRNRKTVNAHIIAEHPEYHESEHVWSTPYKSCLTLPLTGAGRTVGVLVLASRRKRRFSQRTIALAETVALPLAMFITTARVELKALETAKGDGGKPEGNGRSAANVLQGTTVSDGIISGRAYLVAGAEVLERIPVEYADAPEQEKAKLEAALAAARAEAEKTQKQAASILPEADAAIFFTHLLLLEDPSLKQRIRATIDRGFSLKFALRLVAQELEKEMK